jgi:hypothetical protein
MKNNRQALFVELVKALKAVEKGEVCQDEHKVEKAEHYTRRTYETTVLNKNENTRVKIEVHTWWGNKRK